MQISARRMRAQKDDDGDEKSFQNYSLKYFFEIRQISWKSHKISQKSLWKSQNWEVRKDDAVDEKSFQNYSLKYVLLKNQPKSQKLYNNSFSLIFLGKIRLLENGAGIWNHI